MISIFFADQILTVFTLVGVPYQSLVTAQDIVTEHQNLIKKFTS